MILHLLFDDKFADYVINQFSNVAKIKSTFILVSYGKQIKYVTLLDNVKHIDLNDGNYLKLLMDEISSHTAVIFHGLFHPWQEELIKCIPNNIKKAWYFWGGEIYGRDDINSTFLAPLSKTINSIHKLYAKRKNQYFIPKKYFKCIDYCLTSVEEEYEFAKRYFDTDFEFLWYTCYNIEETIGLSLIDNKCDGNNIWIGNSATIENNYFDILFKLKSLKVKERKVIIPLSYGAPWVKKWCNKLGYLLFKDKFNPLLDFLPREEYNKQMLGCSVMIQPHLRPQAHGNIITGLWLGMRVYLSEKCIEYKFFKRLGVVVFSIEKDLKFDNPNVFNLLSKEEHELNKSILSYVYGKKNVLLAVNTITETLN